MQHQNISKFTKIEKKILFLASLGGMLEFYDFVIYGIFSVYFANTFFPTHNFLMSIIESYVVFVLGYIARPVGGIIFSHIGDEHGRKQVLVITVILMGISSLGIGILPSYDMIGIAAPILLLVLRLIQGLALGGELPSTYVYISESIPNRTIMSFAIIMSGIISGLLFGMIINFIITLFLSNTQLINFGWRIPFLIGGLLCLVSYKIRKQLYETKAFERITDKPKFPILYLLKHNFLNVLIGIFITATLAVTIVIFIIFLPTYLQKIVKLNHQIVSSGTLLISIIACSCALLTGIIGEKFKLNVRNIFKTTIIFSIFLVAICYYFISIHHVIIFSMVILGLITGIFTTISPLIITTLFPAKIRLSGVALCYNIGFSIFGGMAPVIITSFIKSGTNKFITPVIYIWVIYLLGFISISSIKYIKSKNTC